MSHLLKVVLCTCLVDIVGPADVSAAAQVPPQGFANCAQAYAAGYSNIPASSPAYALRLDRDGDGVACER